MYPFPKFDVDRCDYLPMLAFKFNHVSEDDRWSTMISGFLKQG